MELFQAFHLVADGLEAAGRAVEVLGQTLEDLVHGLGDLAGLLGALGQSLVIHGGIGDEDQLDGGDVGVGVVLLDVVRADALEADALLDGLLADANLLAVALGRDAHHVALGEDVILHELHVLDGVEGLLLVLGDLLDAEEGDAGEGGVGLEILEVGAVEEDLVAGDEGLVVRDAGEVDGALAAAAELEGGVLHEDELARAEILPRVALVVGPLLLRGAELLVGFVDEDVKQIHDDPP